MTAGRVALIVTCTVVGGLGVWLAIARWDDANKIATAASALGAVAAVGVAVWTVVRAPKPGRSIVASDTGRATAASGGKAVTGTSGTLDRNISSIHVEHTGDAKASGGGEAISGAQLD